MVISALYLGMIALGAIGYAAMSVALIGESRPSRVAFCSHVQLGCLICVWVALDWLTSG